LTNKIFVLWSEHHDTSDDAETITAQVSELTVGSWIVSCSDEPTHFRVRGIFTTFDEAISAYQNFVLSN
jgi:hypothetical protein